MEACVQQKRDKIKTTAAVFLITLLQCQVTGTVLRTEQRDWVTGSTIRELNVAGQTSLLDKQSMTFWTQFCEARTPVTRTNSSTPAGATGSSSSVAVTSEDLTREESIMVNASNPDVLIYFLDENVHSTVLQLYFVLDTQSTSMEQFGVTVYGDEVYAGNATSGVDLSFPANNYFPMLKISGCDFYLDNGNCGFTKLSVHISKKDTDPDSLLLITAFYVDKNHGNLLVEKGTKLRAFNNNKYPEFWADPQVPVYPYLIAGQSNCLVLDAATTEVSIDLRAHYLVGSVYMVGESYSSNFYTNSYYDPTKAAQMRSQQNCANSQITNEFIAEVEVLLINDRVAGAVSTCNPVKIEEAKTLAQGMPDPYLQVGSFTVCVRRNINRIVLRNLNTSKERRICFLEVTGVGPFIRINGLSIDYVFVTFGEAATLTVPAPDLIADDWTVEFDSTTFFGGQQIVFVNQDRSMWELRIPDGFLGWQNFMITQMSQQLLWFTYRSEAMDIEVKEAIKVYLIMWKRSTALPDVLLTVDPAQAGQTVTYSVTLPGPEVYNPLGKQSFSDFIKSLTVSVPEYSIIEDEWLDIPASNGFVTLSLNLTHYELKVVAQDGWKVGDTVKLRVKIEYTNYQQQSDLSEFVEVITLKLVAKVEELTPEDENTDLTGEQLEETSTDPPTKLAPSEDILPLSVAEPTEMAIKLGYTGLPGSFKVIKVKASDPRGTLTVATVPALNTATSEAIVTLSNSPGLADYLHAAQSGTKVPQDALQLLDELAKSIKVTIEVETMQTGEKAVFVFFLSYEDLNEFDSLVGALQESEEESEPEQEADQEDKNPVITPTETQNDGEEKSDGAVDEKVLSEVGDIGIDFGALLRQRAFKNSAQNGRPEFSEVVEEPIEEIKTTVSSFSQVGLITIDFTPPVAKVPDGWQLLFQKDAQEGLSEQARSFVQDQAAQLFQKSFSQFSDEAAQSYFSAELVDFTPAGLQIQLTFSDPLLVSQGDVSSYADSSQVGLYRYRTRQRFDFQIIFSGSLTRNQPRESEDFSRLS